MNSAGRRSGGCHPSTWRLGKDQRAMHLRVTTRCAGMIVVATALLAAWTPTTPASAIESASAARVTTITIPAPDGEIASTWL